MHTTTDQQQTGWHVDIDQLRCPGCHDHVWPDPPARVLLPATAGGPEVMFSHRDGSPLCPDQAGAPAEPIETTR